MILRLLSGRSARFVMGVGAAFLMSVMALLEPASAQSPNFKLLRLNGELVRWGVSKSFMPVRLTYAIATKAAYDDEAINCKALGSLEPLLKHSGLTSDAFVDALHLALRRWERAANIIFEPTTDHDKANILIGGQLRPRGFAFANVALSDERDGKYRLIDRSRVCLNPLRRWKIGFDGNFDVYDLVHTLTHEVGHAIGLDHPTGRKNVMSFQYRETQLTLSAGDIMGLRRIYGPPLEFADKRTSMEARVGATR